VPSPFVRRQQERQWAEARAEAAEAARAYEDAMTAGRPSFTGKIAAPPPQERVAKRFGGGYRAASSSYDWFYGLSRAEQARLRENLVHSGQRRDEPG
jgi:hypothetical protein